MIRSRSRPHAALTDAISQKCEAGLLTAFSDAYCPNHRANATGIAVASDGVKGSFPFPSRDDNQVLLVPPSAHPSKLLESEAVHLKTALGLKGVVNIPDVIFAKKYARVQMASGVIAGLLMAAGATNRRNYLLQVHSKDLVRRSSGAVQSVPMTTYGVAMHYAVVFVNKPFAFAYVECIKSSANRLVRYGRPEKKRNMDCFLRSCRGKEVRS